MRIAFIWPNMGTLTTGAYVDEGRMEPLPLALLAAATPEDVQVVLHDDRLEAIPYDEPTDLAAISVETFTARRSYEIAAEYRRRGVRVALGGMHPTLVPHEAALHADTVCTGDMEAVWGRVVADARAGRLAPRYAGTVTRGEPQRDLLPRRALFRGKSYLPVTLVQFSRGCRFACDFCATSVYFDRTHRVRSVAAVLREIEAQERRLLFFVDDNIVADRAAAKALFRALAPLRVHWVSQASLDMVEDLELMRLMERSGCLGHVIGFESLDEDSLRAAGKTPNLGGGRFGRYAEPIRILRDHGLQNWAAFTLGTDGDTRESIARTVEFAIENRFALAAFNLLTPYPGTGLYRRLQAEGRLLYDGRWWLHPDYRFNHAVFRPARMGPDELTAACFDARVRFNSPVSIFRRMWDPKTHLRSLYRMGVYWTYNPLFRREAFRKQGLVLGTPAPGSGESRCES